MAFDTSDSGPLSSADPQSPRGLFNSMKHIMAADPELLDSYYSEIHQRLSSIFLSISDFRQNSTKVDEKFSETEKKILDSSSALTAEIDNVRQEIPTIPQGEEQNGWYILRHGDFAEIWGSVSNPDTALPLSFESAVAIPMGTVTGSTLTLPEEAEITAVHIIGKEMKS